MPRLDPVFGVAAPELGWVPTPSHVLRRAAVLDVLRDLPAGRLLEVGCGGGALLRDLVDLGFRGMAVDAADDAVELATKLNAGVLDRFEIRRDLPAQAAGQFDCLIAFEVLEHIEGDAEALGDWLGYLRAGGMVVLSVPAHRRRWSRADEWAGHVRRYDRSDVEALLARCGCDLVRIACYGFPALNLLAPLSELASRRKIQRRSRSGEQFERSRATAHSGIDRKLESRLYPVYSSSVARLLFRGAVALQRRFLATELGTGYVIVATKRDL